MTVSGESLATSSAPELLIDTYSQTSVSYTDTSAIFTLTNVDDVTSSNIKFYTVEGTQNGASTLASHTFTPALV